MREHQRRDHLIEEGFLDSQVHILAPQLKDPPWVLTPPETGEGLGKGTWSYRMSLWKHCGSPRNTRGFPEMGPWHYILSRMGNHASSCGLSSPFARAVRLGLEGDDRRDSLGEGCGWVFKSTACYLLGQENYRGLINLLEQQESH